MRAFLILFWRELTHGYGLGGRAGTGRGGFAMPVVFFLAVIAIFPFGVGPDAQLLQRTGVGVVWIAALLAAVLPLDRLVQPDLEQGFFDQWTIRGLSEELVALAKIGAHWAAFAPPLMLATLIAAALLGLDARQLWLTELGLLLGTPGLAALGVLIAALTAGLRSGGALASLLMLPLAVPLLIFGAGSLQPGAQSGLLFLAAASLLLVAISPFAVGGAIRAVRE